MKVKQMPDKTNGTKIWKVLIKGILLFLVVNFALGLLPSGINPGKLSLYNLVFPGRFRLPFGENPAEAHNLSLYDLEVMFSSHEINGSKKSPDEFRIILIGDSATWGTLLQPGDTLSGMINRDGLTTLDGKIVQAYNLAYPSMSLTKDLMILEKALTYDPDLILWPVTLESFPLSVQINTPLVSNNPERVIPLIEQHHLPLDEQVSAFEQKTFWDRTLIGRRRALLDAIQLQMYGVLWGATGIDQTYPNDFAPALRDFEANADGFKNWSPPNLPVEELSWEVMDVGAALADNVPVLVINEPILISKGENSDIRYNFFYPRWAYDQYRQMLSAQARTAKWTYVDLWDIVPGEEFTNSALHLSVDGMKLFYQALRPSLIQMIHP